MICFGMLTAYKNTKKSPRVGKNMEGGVHTPLAMRQVAKSRDAQVVRPYTFARIAIRIYYCEA